MRRALSLTLAAFLAGGLALLGTGTASAHNVLVSSDPKDGQALEAGPAEITLVFDQPVQGGDKFNTITVKGPDDTRWEDGGEPVVRNNSVVFKVRPLGPAAEYQVGYRILSADGHPVSGNLKFSTTKAGGGTPNAATETAKAGESSSDEGGGVPIWVWIIGAVVLLGGGVFFALRGGSGAGSGPGSGESTRR
ncbi:copper resistance CopC family protein [Actinosynnema sp. NPDC047251]|uniref:Copper resistance protein n=1 Tax=Saccharothrix espanaensis (strain ATCC 51144 / DSM 44229 / JCM 9112 / NBRC 15066 / NRRL 15764) TaxID=1179773 RepID=K0JPQ5_SACES|nr:copper resistance CopC family protein [Saccharothrix espanaensis]CCH27381.1 copper resistance protein [Saccharothrix espanaensis DSM 44229]